MVDFHSHFLGGIDDGAKNSRMAFDMLTDSVSQGVDTFVATPHFHPKVNDIDEFRNARQNSFDRLKNYFENEKVKMPRVFFGAEVKLGYSLLELESIDGLFIGDTNYMLLELPFDKWSKDIPELLHSVMIRFKIKPILAHIERYHRINTDFEIYKELSDIGAIMQVNADSFLEFFCRKFIKKLYENDMISLIGSDMHNLDRRKSRMSDAYKKIRKTFGDDFADSLDNNARNILNI